MAIELEGLEFQIEAQSDEGVKHIDSLAESLGKIKKAVKGGLGLNSSVKQLENLNKALSGFHSEKLESLSKALGTLSGVKATIPATLPKRITELGTSLQSLNDDDIDRLERVSNVLHGMGDLSNVKIPKVNVPTTGVAPTMTTPGNSATDAVDSGMEQATSSVQQTTAAVDQAARKTNFLKSILSGIGGAFSKGFSLGTGTLHKLSNALTKVKVAGQKAKTAMSKLKDVLGSALAAKVKQNTAGLGHLLSSLKRIAMYRAIRAFLSALTQAMKEGINNLYQYSNAMGGTFAQSMDRLATSSQYLKNSLGAMAAPIINALAPAIDFVIDKIATLLNYINMLFARLSGASVFTAAKKSAKSYGDSLASAGGSAAKAAKGVKFYGRYMDDSYAIHESKEFLEELLKGIMEIAKDLGITVNTSKTRICKLSSMWRFLQVQYSLTDTGRVIQKINPKRLTTMRRKMKKLVHKLSEKEFDDWYGSWFKNHYRIMSKRQRENMDELYIRLKKEVYGNVHDHTT